MLFPERLPKEGSDAHKVTKKYQCFIVDSTTPSYKPNERNSRPGRLKKNLYYNENYFSLIAF